MAVEQERLAKEIAELRVQVEKLWKQTFGTLPPPRQDSAKPSTTRVLERTPSAATTAVDPALALIESASIFESSNPPSQPKIENHGVFPVGIKNPEPALDLSSIKMEKKEIEFEELLKTSLAENQVVVKMPKRTHAPTAIYAQEVFIKMPLKDETWYGWPLGKLFDPGIETQQVERNNEQETKVSLQFASSNQGGSIDLITFGVDVEKPYVIVDQGLAGRERFINHQQSSKSIEKPFGGDDFSMGKLHQMFANKPVSPMPPTHRAYNVYDEKPRRNSELSLPLKHFLFDPGIDNKLVAIVTAVGCLLSVGINLDFKDLLNHISIRDELKNHCKATAGEESLSYQHKVVSCLDTLKPLLNCEVVQVARLGSLGPVGDYCMLMIFVNTKANTETLRIMCTEKFDKWDNKDAKLVGTDCMAGTYCRVVMHTIAVEIEILKNSKRLEWLIAWVTYNLKLLVRLIAWRSWVITGYMGIGKSTLVSYVFSLLFAMTVDVSWNKSGDGLGVHNQVVFYNVEALYGWSKDDLGCFASH